MRVGITMLIISFLYLLLTGIMYYSKERIRNKENKIYNILLISAFCGIVLELFCILVVPVKDQFPILNYIINRLFLVYLLTFITIFTFYILAISFNNKNKLSLKYQKNTFKVHLFIIVLYIVFTILLFALPLNYYYDGNYVYSYGIATSFLFLLNFIAIFFWFICLFLNVKEVGYKKYLPLFIFAFGGALNLVIRLVNPGILLITVTQTFITIVMYYTIENPDLKMLRKLQIAQNQMEKSNQIKSEFLSSMSHEIRTPLNAIVGYSQLIDYASSLEEAKENAKEIIASSNTLLNMYNNLLDAYKLEANDIKVEKVLYNPKEELNKLLDLFEYRSIEKKLKIVRKINKMPMLEGCIDIIKKVIINIIDNSIKYTDSGRITISAKIIDNNIFEIIVEDTGVGIKDEEKDKLFKNFERLDFKDSNVNGMGLGLTLSKNLIELIDGTIDLKSVYGKGTKVIIKVKQEVRK